MSGDAGSFFDRWSRRKAALRDGRPDPDMVVPEATPPAAVPAADEQGPAAVDEDALSDAELAEHHGLPDPEAMQVGDDVAAFMRAGVPARLRRLALRRLWRLSPEIVAHDGLTDYAEDYTDAATVVPGMKTLYQVGRGAAAHLQDLAERLGEEAGPEAEGVAMRGEEPDALTGPAVQPAVGEVAGPVGPSADSETERVPASRPARRHMVFTAPAVDGERPG